MLTNNDAGILASQIKDWGISLGFQQLGIADIELAADERYLLKWLGEAMHGDMHYMEQHGTKRSRPAELLPGTIRIISARMDYLPDTHYPPTEVLNDPTLGYVSRYATGRDYHKVIRRRLKKLAERIASHVGTFGYRVFADSAPVLEKAIARNAGLGWIGKHTNLINPQAGSWFFLGEIYTDLPLPVDEPFTTDHCGSCTACIDACPTDAIVAPYKVDARRCISYLTIESSKAIAETYRPALGNRIYGCDDCQLACPWNKFSHTTTVPDFAVRHRLDGTTLVSLFRWTREEFLQKTAGMAIRRISYEMWLRNIATALGNLATALDDDNKDTRDKVVSALLEKRRHPSDIVREHVAWALRQYGC